MNINKIGISLFKNASTCGKWLTKKPQGCIKYVSEPIHNSFALSKSMHKNDAFEMLFTNKIRAFSALDKEIPMRINGQDVIGKWINGGGSKCAYKVKINGEEVCILLPHSRWSEALNEPQNTIALKKLGLITNDYCKIVPVEIDGVKVPALATKPYDNHSFKIFDKKNPNDILDKYYDISKITDDNIEEVFGGLIKDVKTLINNDIHLGYDSFNLALIDGKLRIYFNDLPYGKLSGRITDKQFLTETYLDYVMDSIPNSISWSKINNYPFIKSLNSLDGQDKIMPKLLEIFNRI